MTQIPHILNDKTPYEQTITLINDNTNKTAQDISDYGATFSRGVGSYSVTLAAGTQDSQLIGVTDDRPQYQGQIQIVPRAEVYVDNDGDDNYLLGWGGSLSADQSKAIVSVWVTRRQNTGDVADFVVQLHNFGSSSHTYYVYVDDSYMASPGEGAFR